MFELNILKEFIILLFAIISRFCTQSLIAKQYINKTLKLENTLLFFTNHIDLHNCRSWVSVQKKHKKVHKTFCYFTDIQDISLKSYFIISQSSYTDKKIENKTKTLIWLALKYATCAPHFKIECCVTRLYFFFVIGSAQNCLWNNFN